MPVRRPLNYDQPKGVPVAPMGRIPVIARLEWEPSVSVWVPAYAIRWTSTHVMVCYVDEQTEREDAYDWLHARDVMRKAEWLVDPAVGGPPAKDRPPRERR